VDLGNTVRTTLLLDLRSLGVPLDDIEQMTWGRAGRRAALARAHQRQRPRRHHQVTQVLAFAVD
jgi:hypothetical protein